MTLAERDQAVIWHPFTQHHTAALPFVIKKAKGAALYDENGKRYLDLISSWWVNIHGHSHPVIAKAIYEQACELEHVIFSHFTHEPAIQVAETILNFLPPAFSKVFFSDNGSTAVEVALKMAYQFWRNQGNTQRTRFIAFENAYHGDTFGAMSVGKRSGFFSQFEDLLFTVDMFPYPTTWLTDNDIEAKENAVLLQLQNHLEEWGSKTAAMIIEPLVQGASGMRMCRPQFLQKLEKLLRHYQVIIIYDEVMTGFGRTGNYFACHVAKTTPDIICMAKGLTGGFLPLALTVCSETIYQAFLGDQFQLALAHGHSFTANPLGCAAALASLQLLVSVETQKQLRMIEATHQLNLQRMQELSFIHKHRYCGTIAAFDLKNPLQYGSTVSIKLRDIFLEKGLLLRPLGNVIYLLPPYCITEEELQYTYESLTPILEGVL